LFRKLLDGPANPSIYILAFTTLPTWHNGENAKHVNVLLDELSGQIAIPSPSMMVSLDGRYYSLLHRIHSIAGAQLFAVPDHGVIYRH
jgi:hypothetical protein